MSKVGGCKRNLKTRTTTEKYKILKEVEKENHVHPYQRSMAFQANIIWMVKRKNKVYSEVEKYKTSAKRVRMRLSRHEDLDKACYMWLLNA